MSMEAVIAQEYESLEDTEEVLAGAMSRLRTIIEDPDFDQDRFVEITSIYNNVSYIFLYLESNEVHVNYDRLLPWRDAFYGDPELDRKILRLVRDLRCAEPDVEASRQAYEAHLREKANEDGSAVDARLEELQSVAKEVLRQTANDQIMMLKRLRVNGAGARPEAVFYRVVSGNDNASTRAKLGAAWRRARDARLPALIEAVDAMIEARHRRSREHGHASPLAETMLRCRVAEDVAAAYLERYLESALASHAELEAEIRGAVGDAGVATDHFGYYVGTLVGGRKVPQFLLDDCLEFAFSVAREVFGLTVTRGRQRSPHVLTVELALDGREVGQINFDLWQSGERPRAANQTRGIRNRTDWAGLVQRPIAYVSCRFQRDADGGNRITFQNAHSLFHEFGHAINHLLIRKRLPNQSGLEYLPLERLEDLSMWFEKWVYHPEFADGLGLSPDEREGLALCQRVKLLEYRRTHVDRAVTALLDFDVHRRLGTGVRGAFDRLDERFAVSRFCTLGDFPVYFTWPMFQANPGANFAYLWGAAASAERFAPFLVRPIAGTWSPAEVRAAFTACFDYDEPSTVPDSAAVFDFYDRHPTPTLR